MSLSLNAVAISQHGALHYIPSFVNSKKKHQAGSLAYVYWQVRTQRPRTSTQVERTVLSPWVNDTLRGHLKSLTSFSLRHSQENNEQTEPKSDSN